MIKKTIIFLKNINLPDALLQIRSGSTTYNHLIAKGAEMKKQFLLCKSVFIFLLVVMLGLTFGSHDVEAADPPVWKGSVNIGASLQSGNTDRFNAAAGADAMRKSEQDRYSLNLLFNYSEEDGNKTAESYYGAAKYDYFFTQKLYGYIGLELLKDEFKDLTLRTIIGPGAGYQIWDEEIRSLSVEGGISYFSDNYKVAEDADWIAGRLAGNLMYKLLSSLTFTDQLIIYPSFEDIGDFNLRNEAAIATPLASGWALKFVNILEYDSDPPANIKETDVNWILTLQYSF